jgi:hypothetical protein
MFTFGVPLQQPHDYIWFFPLSTKKKNLHRAKLIKKNSKIQIDI